jgi:hypothetical protein
MRSLPARSCVCMSACLPATPLRKPSLAVLCGVCGVCGVGGSRCVAVQTQKSDVFSYGVLLINLFDGQLLWPPLAGQEAMAPPPRSEPGTNSRWVVSVCVCVCVRGGVCGGRRILGALERRCRPPSARARPSPPCVWARTVCTMPNVCAGLTAVCCCVSAPGMVSWCRRRGVSARQYQMSVWERALRGAAPQVRRRPITTHAQACVCVLCDQICSLCPFPSRLCAAAACGGKIVADVRTAHA